MRELLTGKVAIITGGGSGIGREACEVFAEEGAVVIVADASNKAAIATVKEIRSYGRIAHAFEVDVTDPETIQYMVDAVMEEYGHIDILVNNAGITKDNRIINMTKDEWDEVIDVNLTGVFNCTKAIVPIMIAQGEGRIINTSSVVGTDGNFGQVNYAATKGGVIAFSKSLAKEVGPKGIHVNAVAPGFILTPMVKAMPEKVIKKMEADIPLGHLGEPEDVANTYLFLASHLGKYYNGAVLAVDGGIKF